MPQKSLLAMMDGGHRDRRHEGTVRQKGGQIEEKTEPVTMNGGHRGWLHEAAVTTKN